MKKVLMLFLLVSVLALGVPGQGMHAGAQEAAPISGKVVETMDSGGYTYALIDKDGKQTWVAVPKTKVEKGTNMSFQPGVEMENFTSKTLKRTFDKIIFSAGPVK